MNHKTRIVWILLAALALMVSSFGAAAGAKPTVASSGNVFTVYPTGGDDTENIRQAFELAKTAGPGSTVLLAPGNFKTRLMEIWDFDGYFKGSGEGVTVIDTFPDQECQSLVNANRWPGLFMFFRGYPRVSDLKIHITPANPCLEYNFPPGGPDFNITWIIGIEIVASPFNPLTDCMVLQKEPVRGLVERVTIEAEPWDVYEQWTLWGGLWFGGLGSTLLTIDEECPYRVKFGEGNFTIRNTTVRNTIFGLSPNNLVNSIVQISDSFLEENASGIPVNDFSGSVLEIRNNVLEAGDTGIVIAIGAANSVPYIAAPSAFNIHHNEFNTFSDSIQLFDYENTEVYYPPQGSRIKANIHHNHMVIYPEYANAVWGEFVDGVLVHQNTVEGNSLFAFAFGAWGPSRYGQIMGNDLHNYTSNFDPPSKIYLGPGTEHYRVVVDEADSVWDEGTNNTVNEMIKRMKPGMGPMLLEILKEKLGSLPSAFPSSAPIQGMSLYAQRNYLYLPVVQSK